MAKDSSFDIVSEADMQEIDNAFQQTAKEILSRFDLKESGARITFSKEKGKENITIKAPTEFVLKQVQDILKTKFAKRNLDFRFVRFGNIETAAGGTVRVLGEILAGIEEDLIKKLNKDIKNQKFNKVKTQITGDKIRVSSPSKNELQKVISFVEGKEYIVPLQFVNYR
ncbi:MAG: YajQ family cyclic di-GMP-binding protein [Clostridiales Family XIII bacterium]|jgi:uncharacterized protein YajQ (UPF0234 family)|nr:YajQ family cyclic di-GMP-binding protein [Clostridiales Family XIII bacterium]